MRVWIDQDLCTGDGLCAEVCPDVFMMADDGLAYVKEDGVVLEGGMRNALALVPITLEGDVVEAAETCPGECIFWEVQE